MAQNKASGVYQMKDGTWGYRFSMIVEGKTISRKKTTDEFGNKLKTKKQAIKARENAMVEARIERERQHKISRRTVEEVYAEYCEKGRGDRAYMTIRKQDYLWNNHIKEQFGKRYIDEISVVEINDYLADLYYKDLVQRMKVHKHFYKTKEACKPHAAKVVIELLFNCGEAAEKC